MQLIRVGLSWMKGNRVLMEWNRVGLSGIELDGDE